LSKSVATDLRHHYPKSRIIQGLRTKSLPQARYAAQKLASRLDDWWLNLRLKEAEIPAAHLLRNVPSQNIHSTLPTITDALDLYRRVKGHNRSTTFFTHSIVFPSERPHRSLGRTPPSQFRRQLKNEQNSRYGLSARRGRLPKGFAVIGLKSSSWN
jgi:hypothetical protein